MLCSNGKMPKKPAALPTISIRKFAIKNYMNSVTKLFFVFLFLFSVAACKKKAVPVKSETPVAAGLKVDVLNTEFSTFSAKGRMQLEKPDEKLSSAVTIRIKKDSVIWVSVVPALGIEVARVRITPDTIQILDRLHKEYLAGNFSLLQKRFNIAADFKMLQAILLGNYLPGLPGQEKEIESGDLQHIRQQLDNLTFDQFLNRQTRKLTQFHLSDSKTKDAMMVVYNDFEMLQDKPIATAILMTLNRASAPNPNSRNAIVTVKYNKFNLNDPETSFPFTVPKDYQRK
jgi:hypothetical protein